MLIRENEAPRTILIVEDESGIRGLVRQVLEMSGYHVLEAGSGHEALAIAKAWGGIISLLITDIKMPEMNGREVARRLALLRPGLNTLFVSGYTEDEVLRADVEASTCAFLQKPFSVPSLLRQVKSVIGELQPV